MTVINRQKLQGTGLADIHNPEFLDTLDQALDQIAVAVMDPIADATGGETDTVAAFTLTDPGGQLLPNTLVEFVAYTDGDLVTIVGGSNAEFNTETEGVIVSLDGPAIKLRTDAFARFSCRLANPADGTVFVIVLTTAGGPRVHSTAVPVTWS